MSSSRSGLLLPPGKVGFFFLKKKTAYEIYYGLVGWEMCIRDRGGGGTAPDAVPPSTKAANAGTSFIACQFAMPDVIDLDDPSDARLTDYVALRDSSLRKHLEAERGLFIAEGEKVIRRAIEAGYRPRSFMLAPRWLDSLRDVVGDAPVYRVSEATAEAVSGFHVHRGALALLDVWAAREHGVPLAAVAPEGVLGCARREPARPCDAVAEPFPWQCLGAPYKPIGEDFKGSTITAPAGAAAARARTTGAISPANGRARGAPGRVASR